MATKKVRYGQLVRQGDVIIQRTEVSADGLEPVAKDARGLVLAEGETSFHHHAVFGRGARLLNYRMNERMLVVGRSGADVRVVGGGSGAVDRHTPISLQPGNYVVRVQRAYDSSMASSRAVAD